MSVEYFIRNKIVSAYFVLIPRPNKELSSLKMKLWNIIYKLELNRSEEMDISVKCLGNESPNHSEKTISNNRNTTQSETDVLDVVFKYLLIPQKVHYKERVFYSWMSLWFLYKWKNFHRFSISVNSF